MENAFSLYQQETPTNQNLTITFTPNGVVSYYTYQVFRDGELIDEKQVTGLVPSNILLNSTGKFQIKVTVFDYYNNPTEIESGFYHIDQEKPILSVGDNVVTLVLGNKLDVMGGVKAYDNQDGDLLSSVTTNIHELDLTSTGEKRLTYIVSDQAGNVASKSVYIQVVKKNTMGLFAIQMVLIVVLLALIALILRYRRSISLERRISRYSIEPLRDNTLSFYEKFFRWYQRLLKPMVKGIEQSVFLTKYSKRFEKYVIVFKDHHHSGKDLVALKFLVSFLFVIVAIIAKALQYQFINVYELLIPLILGFFTPDIIFFMSYKIHRNRIENDLLQAIIIMNNAFKSGRSITQAISLVATELDGPIRDEFKKMEVELAFGLGVDVIFQRFSDRIQLEEVSYLTASLSILNRTGGNIIKVFDSIERSLFNKKKLKLELASLTSSSKIIVNVLFAVPILFIIFVSLLNPSYFTPFFTNKIGWILMGFMIIYYAIYIIFVRKIMKVRM